MLCNKCGTVMLMEFNNDNQPIYKCSNLQCGNIDIINIKDKGGVNKTLTKYREYADKLKQSDNVPILISNIRKIRIELGLGQGEASKNLGFTAQRYGTIERCENIPASILLMKLVRLFNVTFNDLYDIIEVTQEQYNILKYLVYVNDDNNRKEFRLETNSTFKEMEEEIAAYEKTTGITERKIYKNVDNEEIAKIKNKLKELDSNYKRYREQSGAILNQETVVDYYYWQEATKIINYK